MIQEKIPLKIERELKKVPLIVPNVASYSLPLNVFCFGNNVLTVEESQILSIIAYKTLPEAEFILMNMGYDDEEIRDLISSLRKKKAIRLIKESKQIKAEIDALISAY